MNVNNYPGSPTWDGRFHIDEQYETNDGYWRYVWGVLPDSDDAGWMLVDDDGNVLGDHVTYDDMVADLVGDGPDDDDHIHATWRAVNPPRCRCRYASGCYH